MRIRLNIDEKLLEEASILGRHRSRSEAANAALAEYVQRHRQKRIIELFGKIDLDSKYDYKAERRPKTPGN